MSQACKTTLQVRLPDLKVLEPRTTHQSTATGVLCALQATLSLTCSMKTRLWPRRTRQHARQNFMCSRLTTPSHTTGSLMLHVQKQAVPQSPVRIAPIAHNRVLCLRCVLKCLKQRNVSYECGERAAEPEGLSARDTGQTGVCL
eukprot:scaffold76264_cov14-Tisochrysis_lutea.AAC.1